jgi:hypothetical protein
VAKVMILSEILVRPLRLTRCGFAEFCYIFERLKPEISGVSDKHPLFGHWACG